MTLLTDAIELISDVALEISLTSEIELTIDLISTIVLEEV